MHNRPVNVLLQFISRLMFLKFQKEKYVTTKLTLGVMGLKIITLSQEPVIHSPLLIWKSFIKLEKLTIHDNGKLNLT